MEYDNLPNFDAMHRSEVLDFWSKNFPHRNRAKAQAIFPDRPKGYVKAHKALCAYASNKSAAMLCREEGRINDALSYEGYCDRIYNDLPAYAKW